MVQADSGIKIDMAVIGGVILTVAAIIATYPATAFFLQYYADPQNTGALVVGGFFALLAAVLWGSAGWGWLKILKTRKK